jgi:hypothetical protein
MMWMWTDAALERLLWDVMCARPAVDQLPACPACRKPRAENDCEPDEGLCWRAVTGCCESVPVYN